MKNLLAFAAVLAAFTVGCSGDSGDVVEDKVSVDALAGARETPEAPEQAAAGGPFERVCYPIALTPDGVDHLTRMLMTISERQLNKTLEELESEPGWKEDKRLACAISTVRALLDKDERTYGELVAPEDARDDSGAVRPSYVHDQQWSQFERLTRSLGFASGARFLKHIRVNNLDFFTVEFVGTGVSDMDSVARPMSGSKECFLAIQEMQTGMCRYAPDSVIAWSFPQFMVTETKYDLRNPDDRRKPIEGPDGARKHEITMDGFSPTADGGDPVVVAFDGDRPSANNPEYEGVLTAYQELCDLYRALPDTCESGSPEFESFLAEVRARTTMSRLADDIEDLVKKDAGAKHVWPLAFWEKGYTPEFILDAYPIRVIFFKMGTLGYSPLDPYVMFLHKDGKWLLTNYCIRATFRRLVGTDLPERSTQTTGLLRQIMDMFAEKEEIEKQWTPLVVVDSQE